MADPITEWREIGERNGWRMPPSPWWKRLPVVRHVRVLWHSYHLVRHEQIARSLGMIPTGADAWVLWGMLRGLDR